VRPESEGGEPQVENVSMTPVGAEFARGLAMSGLDRTATGFGRGMQGGSGLYAAAAWRPAMSAQAQMQAPAQHVYLATAALSTVKAAILTATKQPIQHLVTTDAGRGTARSTARNTAENVAKNAARTNGTTEGSSPRRSPV
jgi:hypothetical protein